MTTLERALARLDDAPTLWVPGAFNEGIRCVPFVDAIRILTEALATQESDALTRLLNEWEGDTEGFADITMREAAEKLRAAMQESAPAVGQDDLYGALEAGRAEVLKNIREDLEKACASDGVADWVEIQEILDNAEVTNTAPAREAPPVDTGAMPSLCAPEAGQGPVDDERERLEVGGYVYEKRGGCWYWTNPEVDKRLGIVYFDASKPEVALINAVFTARAERDTLREVVRSRDAAGWQRLQDEVAYLRGELAAADRVFAKLSMAAKDGKWLEIAAALSAADTREVADDKDAKTWLDSYLSTAETQAPKEAPRRCPGCQADPAVDERVRGAVSRLRGEHGKD